MTILLRTAKALSSLGMLSIALLSIIFTDSSATLVQATLILLPIFLALFLVAAIFLTLKRKQSFPRLLLNLFAAATLALFWFVLHNGDIATKTEYRSILAVYFVLALLMSLMTSKEFKRRRKNEM